MMERPTVVPVSRPVMRIRNRTVRVSGIHDILIRVLEVLRIRIRIRIHRIHMFLGLPDPDPLVRAMDPDTALDPDPDPSIIMQ
jgi:hypothetical protein